MITSASWEGNPFRKGGSPEASCERPPAGPFLLTFRRLKAIDRAFIKRARGDLTWHDLTRHDMTRHGMAWHGMTWDDMAGHDMTWHDMTWHDMALHGRTWQDMTWHDMTWHDMAGHGRTWPDMAWHGLTWPVMTRKTRQAESASLDSGRRRFRCPPFKDMTQVNVTLQ